MQAVWSTSGKRSHYRVCDRPRQDAEAGCLTNEQLGGDRGAVLTTEAKAKAKAKAKGIEVRVAKANSRAADLAPILADIRAAGATTLQAVADALNVRGIPTARGGTWSPVQVQVQVQRVEARAA